LRFLIGCKTLINGSFAFGLIGCTLIKPYGLEPFQFQLSLGHLQNLEFCFKRRFL